MNTERNEYLEGRILSHLQFTETSTALRVTEEAALLALANLTIDGKTRQAGLFGGEVHWKAVQS